MNKKFLTLGVVSVLAVMLVSAALVNYLSNEITADVEIKSPLELMFRDSGSWVDSIDLGVAYASDTVEFKIRERNFASNAINSVLEIRIKEVATVNTCAEITSFEYREEGAASWNSIGCQQDGNNLLFALGLQLVPSGQDQNYEVRVTFAPAVVGTYEAVAQHMVLPA
jgi:hypothetical protein